MVTCVLDTSMTLSFVLADEFTPESEQVLNEVARHGALVPTLWDHEVTNALRNAERRGRMTERATTNALHGLQGLPIERDSRPLDAQHVLSLCRQHEISAYDASYIRLALDQDLPLASLDERMRRVATDIGLDLLP